MTTPVRALAATAALSALIACAGTEGRSGIRGTWRAETDTLGDTIVVRTLSGSVWGDTARLEPEISIGVLEGDDPYMFGDVRSIAVRADGEILVLDRQVPALRRFSPAGLYLGDIGREGGGPGEYKRPETVNVLPDGRIVVRDPGNARISVWSADLEPLPSWRLPSGGTFSTSRATYVDTAGNTHTMVLLETGRAPQDWTYGLARFTPEGEHTDTLKAPVWNYDRPVVTASREGSRSSSSVPFSPQTEWTFSPLGYFVGGVATDYRFDLFRPGHVLRIERAWDPVPVLAAEKEEQERRITENFQRSYGSWHWNGPPIPDTKPPFRNLFVDGDGRIWVQVSQPGRETLSAEEAREEERRTERPVMRYGERLVFDVFDADGRFLGPLVPPEGFQASPEPVARGDTVWAVVEGDLGVERVVRFRIVRPARD